MHDNTEKKKKSRSFNQRTSRFNYSVTFCRDSSTLNEEGCQSKWRENTQNNATQAVSDGNKAPTTQFSFFINQSETSS